MKFFVFVLTVVLLGLAQGDDNRIHKKGYCVWYDQCLKQGGRTLNCLYNGPAKTMNDTKGLELLNKICPKYAADRKTCCSTSQLKTLDDNLNTLRQFASRCPACLTNLIDMFCESTCSPDQSVFMDPVMLLPPFPMPGQKESILSINYYASPEFKKGVFDSCKDVVFPENNEKILNLICGESAETCTPEKLVTYMGSTSNGMSPFDIIFPEVIPQNMTWMNAETFKCNESFVNPWTNKTQLKCSCKDCNASCIEPPGNTANNTTKFSPQFYRMEKLIITVNPDYPQNNTGYHQYPDSKFIPFGNVFHLDLLNQSLDLQIALTSMKVPYTENGRTISITLEDVCFKPLAPYNDKCVIQSIFQYFQNSKTELNKCLTDMEQDCSEHPEQNFMSDFHDHIRYCTSAPSSIYDKTFGGTPCLGENGVPINPNIILGGFHGTEYNMANAMIITFVVNNHIDESKNAKAEAWEKAFIEYMKNYVQEPENSKLVISFSSRSEHLSLEKIAHF